MYCKMLYKWDQLRFPFIRPVFLNRRDHVFSMVANLEKNRNEKMKKLWSDLVVQRNRWAYPAQNFELYHMGMVSGVLVLMGVATIMFFMILGPFFLRISWNGLTNMFGLRARGLRMIPNDRARSGRGPRRVFGPKNLEKQGKYWKLLFGFSEKSWFFRRISIQTARGHISACFVI